MVTPPSGINGLTQIARLVQQTVQRRGRPGAAASSRSAAASGGQGADRLAATLAQRVREIEGDAPTRKRLLARLLIESVLLEEFGHALFNDVEFQNVIDDVLQAMEQVPALQTDLDRIVASLDSSSG